MTDDRAVGDTLDPRIGAATVAAADCAHGGRGRQRERDARSLTIALGITTTFMVGEAVGGWLANSLALLADAGHMLADVASLGLALFALRLARKPPTAGRTYGYLRVEILAAAVNGAVLVGIAGLICWRAVGRITAPPEVDSGLMLGVAAAGFVANLVTLRILHAGHLQSLNVRGAYLHVLGDLLGSVGAVGAGVILAVTGWTPVDAVASMLIALIIAFSALRLLKDSVDVLLEATPSHISLAEVARELATIPGVSDVHDLHVWTVTSGFVAMTGHAVVESMERWQTVLDEAGSRLKKLGIEHVTIQLEAGRCE